MSADEEYMDDYMSQAYLTKSLAHWTILDQKRLIAFDALHSRLLEYHNNVHVKETKLQSVRDSRDALVQDPALDSVMVAQIFHCVDENAIQRPFPLSGQQFSLFLQQTKVPASDKNTGCLWIHLKELAVLPQVAARYNMHELCVAGFEDLRCHSYMIPAKDEMLVVLCTHQMEKTDLTMYKLFVYVGRGLVVTYQKEILADPADTHATAAVDTIVDNVLMDYQKLYARCLSLGPMYVVYELAQHALTLQDSAMEYLSCALTYFNRIVHLNLLHREKLDVMLKMHIIASSTILMQRSMQEMEAIFATFVSVGLGEPLQAYHSANNTSVSGSAAMSSSNLSNNGYGLKRLLCPGLIEDRHIPYLVELSDSFIFVSCCLQNIIHETARLDAELDATVQIRSSNTNTMLSLIATTFLPLTFLAGVFGMNFERNADYTMEMLNMHSGPLIFSLMCVLCFLVSVMYFVSQGWIEIAFLRKLYKLLMPNKIDDSRKVANPAAIKRAEVEETRREKARRFRRTQSIASHTHHDWDLSRVSRYSDSTGSRSQRFGRGGGQWSASSSYNHNNNNSRQNPLLLADYFGREEAESGSNASDGDSPLTLHRARNLPDAPMVSRHPASPGLQGRKIYAAPIPILPPSSSNSNNNINNVNSNSSPQDGDSRGASMDSRGSVAMSAVSLGSGFLNPIKEEAHEDSMSGGGATPKFSNGRR